MQCPKCDGAMEERTYGRKITIQRCTQCMGLFCPKDSLEQMKTEWMSEVLDRGSPSTGKQYNTVDEIMCPVCDVDMEKTVDKKQTHIWYEHCPSCAGVWFDAGEFTDWKHETLVDKFRDWFTPKRS